MDVVVVESPTKARSIAKYLGDGFEVLPSFGHVRDLPEKNGSVKPERDFEIIYELLPEKRKRIEEIARSLRKAERLWLATDPDREGEAIAWHVVAALAEKGVLEGKDIRRVVFHEITPRAVQEAMRHPRAIDRQLVDAYQARRALDYLVGFTLSPVLWRKLKGSRSAGRVQSVALRLICERESEIERFVPREYWTIEAWLETARGEPFRARLYALDGRKLDKFALPDEKSAQAARIRVENAQLAIQRIERRQATRHPAPPFTTATLQQEAARKLGFSAKRTMRVAQRLFEGVDLGGETVGLITYMRTDSVHLAPEAVRATRELIGERFGRSYLPERPRHFRTRAKNAQEAHEAIRPTDPWRLPDRVAPFLDDDQRRLYELIWRRTVASQMASAKLERVSVAIGDEGQKVVLRATGQTVVFDGFLRLYQEDRDDPAPEDEVEDETSLPALVEGEVVRHRQVEAKQHFTEPPPRYTEASLVRTLEELGIGRPSTYASIISVLQERKYVRLENRRFVPEDLGRLVNAFLTNFFEHWVRPDFTAELEAQLDAIAAGEVDWRRVLRNFWEPFYERVAEVSEQRVAGIIDALNEALAPKLFPPRADGSDPRACPACGEGRLSLKFGRFGAFIGCSRYPDCRYTRKFGESPEGAGAARRERLLGVDPATCEEVWLRFGRFGAYVQRGSGEAAVRCSLPPGVDPESLDLARALQLLALPRRLGTDPETGEPIEAGINRFGPFVRRGTTFVRLPPEEDVLAIGINRALVLLAGAEGSGSGQRKRGIARRLGAHPNTGKPVEVVEGRFGLYLRHGRERARLGKDEDPATLTLDRAVERLAAEAGAAGHGGRQRNAGRGRKRTGTTRTSPTAESRRARRSRG